ncbi:MAG: alpha-L-arabinofuranosidase C-terminal domain-containing protein [Planctomycetota bacterium]|jgi:alpha-N-arabinofuranosidase
MKAQVTVSDTVMHQASEMLLGSNIEAYENTIPWMLSDRLRNPKFAGPEDPQTGIAPEWEPQGGRCMGNYTCKLIPGMSLSGNESQMVNNYSDGGWAGVMQTGVVIRKGEVFELEIWARTKDKPTTLNVSLRPNSGTEEYYGEATIEVDTAYWSRYTATFDNVYRDDETAQCVIGVAGKSYVVLDQIHLRPQGEGTTSQALLDRFDTLTVPTLRFPGGCVTCNYRWKNGVGPVHLRGILDDPVFKWKTHYDFGTDEYLALCRDKGIRPFITLNVSTATPEECAEWADYCRRWWEDQGLEAPVTYFMFGNENYGTHEIGHMTGEMYAKLLPVFVPGVREAYPKARIMAIGQENSFAQREGEETPWLSEVVEKAADHFDIISVTRYKRCAHAGDLDARMQAVATGVVRNEESITPIFDALDGQKLDSKVGIVEWNYWADTSHADNMNFREPNDIRHCLFVGGMLNLYAHLGDRIEVTNHYSLIVTMGALHIKNGVVEDTDVLKVFDLYAPAFPGEVLESSVEAPLYGEYNTAVNSMSIRKDGKVYTFLVNYHASEKAEVKLTGLSGVDAKAEQLTGTDINTPVYLTTVPITGEVVTLPPMSLTRMISQS